MTTSDPTIWRIHLLPHGGAWGKDDRMLQAKWAEALCHARSVLGMGWAVNADPDENISWSDYKERAKAKYEGKVDESVRRWNEDVKIGDLVWTKTTNGEYYLARVTGEWRYEPATKFFVADMVNVREVKFVFVGNKPQMPDKIVKKFIGGQTFRRVNGVDKLSCDLWNKHCPPNSRLST